MQMQPMHNVDFVTSVEFSGIFNKEKICDMFKFYY